MMQQTPQMERCRATCWSNLADAGLTAGHYGFERGMPVVVAAEAQRQVALQCT